jgi:hypothetical protein
MSSRVFASGAAGSRQQAADSWQRWQQAVGMPRACYQALAIVRHHPASFFVLGIAMNSVLDPPKHNSVHNAHFTMHSTVHNAHYTSMRLPQYTSSAMPPAASSSARSLIRKLPMLLKSGTTQMRIATVPANSTPYQRPHAQRAPAVVLGAVVRTRRRRAWAGPPPHRS